MFEGCLVLRITVSELLGTFIDADSAMMQIVPTEQGAVNVIMKRLSFAFFSEAMSSIETLISKPHDFTQKY